MSDFSEPRRRINIDPEAGAPFPLEKLTRTGPSRKQAAQDHLAKAGRQPPQSIDTEKAVLGAILTDSQAVTRIIETLPAGSFYDPRHEDIYQAILLLFERGNPIDLVTVAEELKRRGKLEESGGSVYLTELTYQVGSAANVEYHARIVAEKSLLRSLITTTGLIGAKAYEPDADAFDLIDAAEQDIFKIANTHLNRTSQSISSIVKNTIERLERINGTEGGITGVPSGLSRLDQLTGGWQPSDLIILAARPSMGKTALSLTLARNAALNPGNPVPVAYFSLEMSADQLGQRMLTSEARVDAQMARTGRLSQQDWNSVARAAGVLSKCQIYIDDTAGLSALELRAKCRRLKTEKDIGLIIVDYLQLMHGSGLGKNANREQEIAQISRALKGLAKELNVPVIALSQLSRAVEQRGGDKRPMLSDLRESGSIEQDADVVMFLYRPEKYGFTEEDGRSLLGVAEIIVGKQRNGPIDTVEVAFVDKYARFENLTRHYDEDSSPAALPQGTYTGMETYVHEPIPLPSQGDTPF